MKKILCIFFVAFSFLYGFESYNYVDKHYKITQEGELSIKFTQKINPFFIKHKLHYFSSFDGVKIAYKVFQHPNAKATLVISSGRTEGMVKYQEFIYDLYQNGYSVYILDHRGQGYSQRLLEDTQIGYVKDFLDYVKDLRFFVKKIVKKDKKMILIGHSMGGAIASLYVETYKKDFDALVLSSPMHQPEIIKPSWSQAMCKLIEKRKNNLERYIIGEESYDKEDKNFDENLLTHSKIRFELMNKVYENDPNTKLGGPSVAWVVQACKGSHLSVMLASEVTIPTLLLQAEDDKIVNLEPQQEFCQKASRCDLYLFHGAYHELFIEQDHIRNKVLTAILTFIAKI